MDDSPEPRYVKRQHPALNTIFRGIVHPSSTSEIPIHQYLGIKYASIPARFRQSKLVTSLPPLTDATKHGPICPQPEGSVEELLFGIAPDCMPYQELKQDEFECLNLNITCPAGLNQFSRLPVMLWVHGGGDRGSGSHWVYDGAPLVRKSIELRQPIILVTFNFRIGFLGSAASPMIREDNIAAGDKGTGNYGLRDQQKCLEWIHRNILGFGGDPENITLFGASSGAADIVCHLLSRSNQDRPMFARAIIQSAVFEPNFPDVASAGWQLSRVMSSIGATDMGKLRAVDVKRLIGLGVNLRVIDDGVFFREGWMDYFEHVHSGRRNHRHPACRKAPPPRSGSLLRPPTVHVHQNLFRQSRSRSHVRTPGSTSRCTSVCSSAANVSDITQPLIIGDSVSDSLRWSLQTSCWTSSAVVRRVKAICQSLTKATNLLRAYDITSNTPPEEIVDHVLELVNDARVAWPTECVAQNARRERGGHGVWRYVFDQEGPYRGIPHHAADLMYLFDTVPLPEGILSPTVDLPEMFFDEPFEADSDHHQSPHLLNVSPPGDDGNTDDEDDRMLMREDGSGSDLSISELSRYSGADEWETVAVDEYSYKTVRDAIQSKWIAFAYGQQPWRDDKVFVFGPEGETGERSQAIFEGRRRRELWKNTFEHLGHQLVSKVGVELSRGPG
ncbi:hypothetical protein NMY22_g1754 [Coprinellus aureogranulatus]|nr:hypothetical protein NMY22_g1754 [Coprinellus aureogranulatus]